MFAKKENTTLILVLLSMLLLISPTPLYADAADISISVAVEPTITYDEVYRFEGYTGFYDGLAAVYKAGAGWGYIDGSGKEVIPCKFQEVYPFYEGLAMYGAWNDSGVKKYGFIDKTGKIVVPAKYEFFDSNYAQGINNKSFEKLFCEGIAVASIKGRYGHVDSSGKEITPFKYDYTFDFSDGRAVVKLNEKYGFVDAYGNEVVPPIYDDARYFANGFAGVKSGKWGLIDKEGNEVLPPKYDDIWFFEDGLARVNIAGSLSSGGDISGSGIVFFVGGKYGFIDTNFNEVIPVQYDYIEYFSNGLAAVKLNDKWGYIDASNQQVIAPKYDYVNSFDENGYAIVVLNNKYGVIDKQDNIVIPMKYDKIYDFHEGLAVVGNNYYWGFVDITGKEVISPKYYYPYDDHLYFSGGVVEIPADDKRLILDKTGNELVLPSGFDWAGRYSEGFCAITNDKGQYGFVDNTGKIIVQPQYDSVSDFFGGLSLVKKDGKYGILKLMHLSANVDGQ